MQAKDIMTTEVVSISPASNVRRAMGLMLAKDISGMPVVDDTGRVCGMLTEGDLMARREIRSAPCSQAESKIPTEADLERYIQSNGWSVGDVMSPNVIAADPQSEVADLAETMRTRKIKRIPILQNGRLVGIVSRRDVLRAMSEATQEAVARGDDAVRLAIITRLHADLGLGRENIEVSVGNAQVLVEGEVETELQRKAVKVLVEGVCGVAGYVDKLRVPSRAAGQDA
ncbi:CBS domain-containing protein [Rhizobium sp. BK251]|uniref:CBS domain-containing protein n=1 Tax=Rhizobium sp. BK251 TaxID=2512125 RepID=UPI00104E1F68|nr:CBS domain-containing protein [Rhizobium sp. BK251]TCL69677.1 BON domain-containing protein [Rhizobium sp. BK251]